MKPAKRRVGRSAHFRIYEFSILHDEGICRQTDVLTTMRQEGCSVSQVRVPGTSDVLGDEINSADFCERREYRVDLRC